jgi:hypothetical protein
MFIVRINLYILIILYFLNHDLLHIQKNHKIAKLKINKNQQKIIKYS